MSAISCSRSRWRSSSAFRSSSRLGARRPRLRECDVLCTWSPPSRARSRNAVSPSRSCSALLAAKPRAPRGRPRSACTSASSVLAARRSTRRRRVPPLRANGASGRGSRRRRGRRRTARGAARGARSRASAGRRAGARSAASPKRSTRARTSQTPLSSRMRFRGRVRRRRPCTTTLYANYICL